MPQIDHVVCPVDFTSESGRALAHAAAWARWYEARLHVVHVAPLQMASAPLAGVAVMLEARPLSEVRRQVEAFVATIDLGGIQPEIDVHEGDPPAQIRTVVSRHAHALLVLGSHERTRLERFVMGSVAQRVVSGATVPVLLVPPHDAASPPETVHCKHIVCAVDLLPSSLEGLRYALSLAAEADAALDVLHVVDGPQVPQPTDHYRVPEYLRHQAGGALADIRAHIPAEARQACTIRERAIIGDPPSAILAAAEQSHAGVIVLGAGDRAHLRSLWLAPTIGAVLSGARCPVLVVPLPAAIGRSLAIGGRLVAAAEWRRFFDDISLRHLGHPTTLTVVQPGAVDSEVRTLPLLGITTESAPDNDVVLMLGSPGTPHLTHVIRRPTEVRVEERHTHGMTRVLVDSGEGPETLIEITRPRDA